MATVNKTTVTGGDKKRSRLKIVTWETLGTGDDGQPATEVFMKGAVHITGNFSGSATVSLQCSGDGTNYSTIITVSEAGVTGLDGPIKGFRPLINSGDGSTDIDVVLVANS